MTAPTPNHNLVKDSKRSRKELPLSRYLEKIAQLGGYLARSNWVFRTIVTGHFGSS
jgi:hypothetical protein